MSNNTKSKVISGFIWRYAERCGAQIVGFVVSVILARLLEPSVYGTIALVTVFIGILQVFMDSGLGESLVQKKNADDLDFSTVFYVNVLFCVAVYILLFLAAPFIAEFYKDPQLTPVIRVLGITMLISGVKGIQQSYVAKKMIFKRFFFATLGGTITAAVIGIWMAYNGFGVWALVAQTLINNFIDTTVLWVTVKWRPKKLFSFKRLKGLYSYGWKMLVSQLISKIYGDIRQLIIGKLYSASDLAFYNKAKSFPLLIINNINASIDSVLLPAMANEQDEREHVKNMMRRTMMTSIYIMAPLMMGLAFVSTPLIRLLLTEKWLPSAPFLAIFCITYMFYPVHTANLNAIKALGRSDIFLKLEILKIAIGTIVLVSVMWFGVMAMAYSLLFTTVTSQIINSWPNKKLLGYSYIQQLKDIVPSILLAAFMGVCVYFIQFIGLPDIITLAIQVPLGAAIYIAGSKLLKLEAFYYVWDTLKSMLEKITKKKV